MKKLLLMVLTAALLLMPLGTVAMADDEMPEFSPLVNEAYTPGEAPAATDVQSMIPAMHAVLLAMGSQGATSFCAEDPEMAWVMLYNLLSMYGQMDDRSVYDGEVMILPSETVMDYSAALFPAPLSPDQLPDSLSDRITYHPEADEYHLYCGNDDLSEIVLTNVRDLGSSIAVSGKLMYVAEDQELASFTTSLNVADNLFGYSMAGLDVL